MKAHSAENISHANNTPSAHPLSNPLTFAVAFDITTVHWCLVTKKDLVGTIATDARLTRAQAARALDAVVKGIQASLVRGDRVIISGFGTFGVSKRKARRVRNPRDGCAMEIAAKRVPRFAPGLELKSAIERCTIRGST